LLAHLRTSWLLLVVVEVEVYMEAAVQEVIAQVLERLAVAHLLNLNSL
jgi:hypothetical protein